MRKFRARRLLETLEPRITLSASPVGLGPVDVTPGNDISLPAIVSSANRAARLVTQTPPPTVPYRDFDAAWVGAPAAATPLANPMGLSATAKSSGEIDLHWTYSQTSESGFYVYKTTDGLQVTLCANVAPGTSVTVADTNVAANTTYYYIVWAYNATTLSGASTIASIRTPDAPPPTPAPTISTRYSGSELVIAGTSGNDSIHVTQSGPTLTIVANGQTYTPAMASAGLFIYTDGGSDAVTIASSVTLRTTVVAVDGAMDSINSSGSNVTVWMDSTDLFAGTGSVHAITSYYGWVSTAVGAALAEPTDSGGLVTVTGSLWGAAPVETDVNQGGVGDCYFLSTLAAMAHSSPVQLSEMAVDMGDGTYVVQFDRGGTHTYVRVDNRFAAGPFAGLEFDHPGASGDIWSMVMEKAYAAFRSGANSYSSLNMGWMGSVFGDFGISNSYLSLGLSEESFYLTVSSALSAGKALTVGTYSSPPNLVGAHAYSIVGATKDGSGHTLYIVRNPWGASGDALEDGGGYATLTFAQMQANFMGGAYAI